MFVLMFALFLSNILFLVEMLMDGADSPLVLSVKIPAKPSLLSSLLVPASSL